MTSDLKTCHIILSQFLEGWKGRFKNLKGLNTEVFLTYFSPRPLPYHFSSSVQLSCGWISYFTKPLKRKKKQTKKTASYAIVELYKPFNSLSFSVARDENSDRQQQNSGRDTKWNVNNFVNDCGIFWCRWGNRGFYDCKQNKYIKLWSKVLYYKWKWGSFFQ